MRGKQADTMAIQEIYEAARSKGLNLDSVSDENLIRSFAEELRLVGKGREVHLSASVRHKLRVMGLLSDGRLTELGLKALEKVDDEGNLAALLSLMERGLLTETKYRRLQLKCWVFASANRIDSIWPELLSRFSAKLRFRDYTDEEFFEVVVNVLTAREGLTESISAYIADVTLKDLNSRDVRNAIGVSRLLKTKDKADVDNVVSILSRQR